MQRISIRARRLAPRLALLTLVGCLAAGCEKGGDGAGASATTAGTTAAATATKTTAAEAPDAGSQRDTGASAEEATGSAGGDGPRLRLGTFGEGSGAEEGEEDSEYKLELDPELAPSESQ